MASGYSHISVVDERPSARSLQNIVEEILQASVERVALRRPLPGDAGALFAQDAAALRRLRARDQQRAVSARFRGARLQPHEAHLQLLLGLRRGIHAAVAGFLHHAGDAAVVMEIR